MIFQYLKALSIMQGLNMSYVISMGRTKSNRQKVTGRRILAKEESPSIYNSQKMKWGTLLGDELSIAGGIQAKAG